MLLIIISWCYILFTLVNFGFVATSALKFRKLNKLLHLLLGLVSILILSHIWAFFAGFGILFHVLLLLFNGIICFVFRQKIFQFFKDILRNLVGFSRKYQVLFSIIVLLILVKSASLGSVLDNENYYIQSIKWLDEYGFVNGLANLHLFFGQSSGWHVLQSVFSFHFLNVDFNDLGGFCLMILNIYALKIAHSQKQNFQILVFLPVLNWFLLEFCVVPSPDFGIIFFGIILSYLFLKVFKHPRTQDFYLVLLLFLSAILVKVTSIGLIVFPMVLLFKLKIKSLKFYSKSSTIVLIFASLWIGKNLVISGYPLFPSDLLSDFFSFKHQIPDALYNFSLRNEKLVEFFATTEDVKSLSNFDLFWKWLTHSKVSLIFNVSLLFSVVVMPFLIVRFKSKSAIWWIYLSFIIQLVFLALTSPQYRFAIHYLIIFALLVLNFSQFTSKYKLVIFSCSQILVLWFILFPVQFDQLTSKNYNLTSNSFQIKNLIFPAPNSSIKSEFEIKETGNLKYFSPVENVYFWSTGDGDLPCVNKSQLNFFSQKIKYRPQLRDSSQLSKGFYSEKISAD